MCRGRRAGVRRDRTLLVLLKNMIETHYVTGLVGHLLRHWLRSFHVLVFVLRTAALLERIQILFGSTNDARTHKVSDEKEFCDNFSNLVFDLGRKMKKKHERKKNMAWKCKRLEKQMSTWMRVGLEFRLRRHQFRRMWILDSRGNSKLSVGLFGLCVTSEGNVEGGKL